MKYIYTFIIAMAATVFISCETDDTKPLIVNTSDLTLEITDNVAVGDTVVMVPGASNRGALNFSIASQVPNGAVTISEDTFGILTVANAELFDATLNPQIIISIDVSKEEVTQSSTITLNLISGDSDGDGVTNNLDEAPNDPCLPVQMEGYNGFNATNTIWADADCDNDGTDNRTEVANGTDPYAEETTCDSTVDTTIWEGELTAIEDFGDGSPIISTVQGQPSCGTLVLNGDIIDFGCPRIPAILIRFTPESEGATNGTIMVAKQEYDCDERGGIDFEATGTYNETSQTIIINYSVIEAEFPDDPLTGTVEVTPNN